MQFIRRPLFKELNHDACPAGAGRVVVGVQNGQRLGRDLGAHSTVFVARLDSCVSAIKSSKIPTRRSGEIHARGQRKACQA